MLVSRKFMAVILSQEGERRNLGTILYHVVFSISALMLWKNDKTGAYGSI